MKLSHLLEDLAEVNDDVIVRGLCLDSRNVVAGDLFIALNGALQHGLRHAPQALAQGALAVIYDPEASAGLLPETGQPLIAVAELSRHLGCIAERFYGLPSRQLQVIGITGTNGKTTCSQLLAQALDDCGVIGTLGWGTPGQLQATVNTTPDALALQQMLRSLLDAGQRSVAMEVSSHGLQQGRVNGIRFTGAVFTNLTRDHLDYHASMEDYLAAKLELFRRPGLQFAVVNLDDACHQEVLQALDSAVRPWGFSCGEKWVDGVECVFADQIEHHADHIAFAVHWRGQCLNAITPVVGAFNVQNVLTVLCVLLALDWPFTVAVARLAALRPVTGRMEKFGGNGKPAVYVDYAHTPDALEKVLRSTHCSGRLWAIFGCGGDRDKGKRPQMGRVAETWADYVVLTDDNPRSEVPQAIIDDILTGCSSNKIRIINDRKTAISTVIKQAAKDDCVVVAGKGHENYQEIGSQKLPFSDQLVVESALSAWEQSL